MKITLVTSCTGRKKYNLKDQLCSEDFLRIYQPSLFRLVKRPLRHQESLVRLIVVERCMKSFSGVHLLFLLYRFEKNMSTNLFGVYPLQTSSLSH
jgi:hypothetical protein